MPPAFFFISGEHVPRTGFNRFDSRPRQQWDNARP